MELKKNDIIKLCSKNLRKFENVVIYLNYEAKGIFNSEILMFVSIVDHLKPHLIIESGRARGHSTKVICEFFSDSEYDIHSVEYHKFTNDSIIAMKELYKYKNLTLHFANAFQAIPKLTTNRCCVLIDGPKGVSAIKLAVELLKNPLVVAVFIHDLHKDSPERPLAEKLFSNTFFSDDEEFVETFKKLDDPCWETQGSFKEFKNWGPYRRGERKMKSYSSTLGVIFNGDNAINNQAYEEYFKTEKQNRGKFVTIERIVRKLFDEAKRRIVIPFWFCMYYVTKLRLGLQEAGNEKE